MNNTVRTYPRSLAQAYPKDHAAAIEIHRKPKESLGWRVVNAFAVLMLVFLLGALALGF